MHHLPPSLRNSPIEALRLRKRKANTMTANWQAHDVPP